MNSIYIISRKDTGEIIAYESLRASADLYNPSVFDISHWVISISGQPPKISRKSDRKELTGNFTFTNGLNTVSVDSGLLNSEASSGQYIVLVPDILFVKIDAVDDDNNLTLAENYTGTGGTGKCLLFPEYNVLNDTRGWSEKRRCAYEMELDTIVRCYTGQKELDDMPETEVLSGTATFTNGQASVPGILSFFSSELSAGDYIQLASDSKAYRILSIQSNISLTLAENYEGTGGLGVYHKVMKEKGMAEEKRREIKNLYPSS